jgi:hypothetical protein
VLESLEDGGQVNEQSLQCDDLPPDPVKAHMASHSVGRGGGLRGGHGSASQPGEEQHWWSEHKDDIISCVMKMRSAGQIWRQHLVSKKNLAS